ncbi:hypothetical protein KIW84_053953 [Lathyrus oleraceus]|uniref:Importin N-terminal domain-containing protein n=1 Tax=Pisum sativum TaxID=3888 RepID=A0A9D5AHN0_PEA|nr:hypothetical protein KIW84_053953 [Pisum sativum]
MRDPSRRKGWASRARKSYFLAPSQQVGLDKHPQPNPTRKNRKKNKGIRRVQTAQRVHQVMKPGSIGFKWAGPGSKDWTAVTGEPNQNLPINEVGSAMQPIKKRKSSASGSRQTSACWEHFIRLADDLVDAPTAACKHCHKKYLCDPTGSYLLRCLLLEASILNEINYLHSPGTMDDLKPVTHLFAVDITLASGIKLLRQGFNYLRSAADSILRDLQENPDMWLQVMHILQNTQNLNTKFFALQVLEGVIKYRWNALPAEQRDGMKNFISDIILSSNEASFRAERLYVSKLNIILVQILKHEWPARWRSFIPDLVSAAKTSETICENCMAILKASLKAKQLGSIGNQALLSSKYPPGM